MTGDGNCEGTAQALDTPVPQVGDEFDAVGMRGVSQFQEQIVEGVVDIRARAQAGDRS